MRVFHLTVGRTMHIWFVSNLHCVGIQLERNKKILAVSCAWRVHFIFSIAVQKLPVKRSGINFVYKRGSDLLLLFNENAILIGRCILSNRYVAMVNRDVVSRLLLLSASVLRPWSYIIRQRTLKHNIFRIILELVIITTVYIVVSLLSKQVTDIFIDKTKTNQMAVIVHIIG